MLTFQAQCVELKRDEASRANWWEGKHIMNRVRVALLFNKSSCIHTGFETRRVRGFVCDSIQ